MCENHLQINYYKEQRRKIHKEEPEGRRKKTGENKEENKGRERKNWEIGIYFVKSSDNSDEYHRSYIYTKIRMKNDKRNSVIALTTCN